MKRHGEVLNIPTHKIRPFASQPREYFAADELAALEASIKQRGQIQSGLVRELHDCLEFDYELVDGQRRWTACCRLGIPFRAELIQPADEAEQFEISITANFQSASHTPMEIAKACTRLYQAGRSEAYIANLFGRSAFWVSGKLHLTKLIPEFQEMLDPVIYPDHNNRLPVGLAENLARLDPDEQKIKYRQIQRDGIGSVDRTTLRENLKESGEVVTRKISASGHANFIDSFFVRFLNDVRRLEQRLTGTAGLAAALANSGKLQEIGMKVSASRSRLDLLQAVIDETLRTSNVKPILRKAARA